MHEDICNNLIVDYAQVIGRKSPSRCFLREKNNYSCVDILLYDPVREEVSNVINNIPVNDIPEILEKFGIKPVFTQHCSPIDGTNCCCWYAEMSNF